MIKIFGLADYTVTKAQIRSWLKRDDEEEYAACSDVHLAIFLNGLISERRGKKEGAAPEPEKRINNNIVLRKLKIAMNFKDSDVMDIMNLSSYKLGKHELSAFFRRKDHKNYRECKDQVLRNFLQGLQVKYRDDSSQAPADDKVEKAPVTKTPVTEKLEADAPLKRRPTSSSDAKKADTKKPSVNKGIWGKG